MGIPVKLEAFEGPLDLLLHLIDKNKIDIYDIPIAMITEQYLEYVETMEKRDMNVMSEFIVMGTTLINIKSRMLLPSEKVEEEEQDPRQELVERLLEYKKYKYMSYELKDLQVEADKVVYKSPTIPEEVKSFVPKIDTAELLSGLTLSKLHGIFEMVMKKQVDKIDPIRSRFRQIEKETVNLPEKMQEVEEYAKLHRQFGFRQMLEEQSSKLEIIITFLAILELMKVGKLSIVQEILFDEIYIRYNEENREKKELNSNGN